MVTTIIIKIMYYLPAYIPLEIDLTTIFKIVYTLS